MDRGKTVHPRTPLLQKKAHLGRTRLREHKPLWVLAQTRLNRFRITEASSHTQFHIVTARMDIPVMQFQRILDRDHPLIRRDKLHKKFRAFRLSHSRCPAKYKIHLCADTVR